MSGSLVDRITAVLRLHGDHDTRANADYLAERVAEALQLTEEWTVRSGNNIHNPLGMDRNRALKVAEKWPESFQSIRRWVSAWSAVEDKP